MTKAFQLGRILHIDKLISKWRRKMTCPGCMAIPCKPWKYSNKYHTICCCKSSILFAVNNLLNLYSISHVLNLSSQHLLAVVSPYKTFFSSVQVEHQVIPSTLEPFLFSVVSPKDTRVQIPSSHFVS